MSDLDHLYEALREEFVRTSFPNGRQSYMEEFEAKFEAMFDHPVAIDRGANPYWKNRGGADLDEG